MEGPFRTGIFLVISLPLSLQQYFGSGDRGPSFSGNHFYNQYNTIHLPPQFMHYPNMYSYQNYNYNNAQMRDDRGESQYQVDFRHLPGSRNNNYVSSSSCTNQAPCTLLKHCPQLSRVLKRPNLPIVFHILEQYQCGVSLRGELMVCCTNNLELQCLQNADYSCTLIENCPNINDTFYMLEIPTVPNEWNCGMDAKGRLHVCCRIQDIVIQTRHTPLDTRRESKQEHYATVDEECGFGKFGMKMNTGETADVGDFPWLAILVYARGDEILNNSLCSGAIISPRHILTAAHCVHPKDLQGETIVKVRVGVYDRTEKYYCMAEICTESVEVDVADVTPHSGYQYGTRDMLHDIALIRLAMPLKYNTGIASICLPVPGLHSIDYQVAGWGIESSDGEPSQKLKTAQVPLVSQNDCFQDYEERKLIRDNQICAGGQPGVPTANLCRGDSGGPLVTFCDRGDGNVRYFAVGVISQTVGCFYTEKPIIFTRVDKYLDWIVSLVNSS